MKDSRRAIYAGAAAAVALAAGGAGIAAASGDATNAPSPSGQTTEAPSGHESAREELVHVPDSSGSRLDDGADLLPQTKISEQDAIAAAQSAASGSLNEVDLEDYQGTLVFNVDVGSSDVKVDAATGKVLAAPQDE